MAERDYAPLSQACVRGLCDKMYEKRKFAGVEIEKMVKDFNDANNTNQLKRLIKVLGQDLMMSTNPNVKNGALMGLSSVAVALGIASNMYVRELTEPIIACFSEAESRVRYQAAEALYNVLKMTRGASLEYFPVLFDALARLAADPEQQVRQASELIDRLLKDIVSECGADGVPLSEAGALVRARLYARGGARALAAGWLAVLDHAAPAATRAALPALLDPLLLALADPQPEIRRMCEIQLNEFLRSIKKDPSDVEFDAIINILITHAHSTEELIQVTSLTWLKEMVSLRGPSARRHAASVLKAALPCLAYMDGSRRNIRDTAATVNLLLTKLVSDADSDVDVSGVAGALRHLLAHPSVHTRVAALDWLLHLFNKMPKEMSREAGSLFSSAVPLVADPSEEVTRAALAVLAAVCGNTVTDETLESSPYYHKFLESLQNMLESDENLMEERGAFIIRQTASLLGAEGVLAGLSGGCGARLVRELGAQLAAARELHQLRARLRAGAASVLLQRLARAWLVAPAALLQLCLLARHYRHAARLVHAFGELEITVDFLTEIDKLVQLIESPIFAFLRLELLHTSEAACALRRALCGLLMLLPQSEAFHTLRRRLQCAPALEPRDEEPVLELPNDIDIDELLTEFHRVQAEHRERMIADAARDSLT